MDEPRRVSGELHVCVRFEDESFWATVDEFPGVFATGDNLDELRESLEEGISLYLAQDGQELADVKLAPLHAQPVATRASSEIVYA
jgi:predicted RNase H-like HicB family nuclease